MTNEDTKMPEPMSKEEMIDTLKGLVFGTFDRTTAKEREALDFAIKALEQEPCEDAIIREDAINVAIDAVDEWDGGCNTNRATMISNAIKKLPSVTPSYNSIKTELKPCEDCISREDAIKQCGFGMTNLLIADCLRRLPSVTPKAESEDKE